MYKTQYLKIDPLNPESDILVQAAKFIRAGELVAFPTDTVYGLGADASNESALERIFVAKDRPQDKPLLVHVSSLQQLKEMTSEVSTTAELLIKNFWPGPLAIILSGRKNLPIAICGDNGTVGFRMPDNQVALELINLAGPIAAPSANLSGRPSPVNAEHVKEDLDGKIRAVLDAGTVGLGIESTIVDMSKDEIIVLRCGGISIEDIERVLLKKIIVKDVTRETKLKAKCRVVLSDMENYGLCFKELGEQNNKIGIASFNNIDIDTNITNFYLLNPNKPESSFYSILREAEKNNLDALIVINPKEELTPHIALTMDRIKRSAQ